MDEFSQDETKFDSSDLLEPFSFYKEKLKDAFHKNAEEYFDYLTKKAGTDIEANKIAVNHYQEEETVSKGISNNLNSHRGLKGFYIFLIVLCAIGIVVSLLLGISYKLYPIYVTVIIPVILAGLIVLLAFGIHKQNGLIKGLSTELDKHQSLANKHKDEAERLMATLNNLFEGNMAAKLMSKTTPVVDLDKDFDPEKYAYLHDKYGYETSQDKDISTLFAQSGHILGNPFVIEKNYHQSMRDHTYTGSITITWTERVSDGKGGYHYVTRSQVLTASVVAPEPAYYINTRLIYGNSAAPNLNFSRHPTGHGKDEDKKLEKYINNFDKKLDKMVEKDLGKDSSNFTRLHNVEFEALFNALDRDNELEFRLLFTPLAQKNLIALIKDKDNLGYGDDFSFYKRKTLNYIDCAHLQGSANLDKEGSELKHYSYEECKSNFIRYCDNYCKEIYFALAPLISIPLYQQHKTREYIYNGKFQYNVTQAEAESAANCHSWNLFKHPATRSLGVILKARYLNKNENVDNYMVTAHSFSGTDRVTYISKYGGDGRWHEVPVHWIEYNPISKDTPFSIGRSKDETLTDFNNNLSSGKYQKVLEQYSFKDQIFYKKGLFSFVKKD